MNNAAACVAASQLTHDQLARLASAHGVGSLGGELREMAREYGFLAMARAAEGEMMRRAVVEG